MVGAFYVHSVQVGFFSESQASHCLNYRKTSNVFSPVKPVKARI